YGYLAGNMGAQLRGARGDQVEAGLQGVLRVYERVRQKVANYYVPEVDSWATQGARGALGSVADSVRRNGSEDCGKKKPARFDGKVRLEPRGDSTPRSPRSGAEANGGDR